MKKFNQWIYIIALILLIVVLIDLTITWLKHPANNDFPMELILTVGAILLTGLGIWFLYTKHTPKKK